MRLEERLRLLESPLLASPGAREQLESQVRSILAATAARLAAPDDQEPDTSALSIEIGSARATAEIHPRESLRAVALALHAEIMERVSVAAVPYVSLLLQRMHTSQFDERRRIARDLHDGAAHAVGVAMQHIELYDAYLTRDPAAAPPWLWSARQSLEDALTLIRGLSAELGSSPTEDGLDKALTRYLDADIPPSVTVHFASSADVDLIPAEVGDQLYFVIREAVRNALLHAQTTEIRIALNVAGNIVTASVEDVGRGLDVTAAMNASRRKGSGSGLTSMRERVELLGGAFTLTSLQGQGTRAEIMVPLLTARR
jgi:signal transduction histidine kinase